MNRGPSWNQKSCRMNLQIWPASREALLHLRLDRGHLVRLALVPGPQLRLRLAILPAALRCRGATTT